ncbi:hypothetical protein GNIT_0932 [Glaciecola nitratireducens FR1064]|uniref:Uncharacterized protein n=1 Tax=Glaciecola nitratireducens (strain JCM 12485 / KCTC 12276 / FR1064) TaxID=1085623 RepID=G4QFX9_GLANF|nr:hypothetical protein GNIT_0932 [Glaciecola nitratireducens FR1064]
MIIHLGEAENFKFEIKHPTDLLEHNSLTGKINLSEYRLKVISIMDTILQ